MPGTFSPPLTSKKTTSLRSRHASLHVRHARAVMHVGIANPRCPGKRSQHSRRMHNPQFYVPGKRPIGPADSLTLLSTKISPGMLMTKFGSCTYTWSARKNVIYLYLHTRPNMNVINFSQFISPPDQLIPFLHSSRESQCHVFPTSTVLSLLLLILSVRYMSKKTHPVNRKDRN